MIANFCRKQLLLQKPRLHSHSRCWRRADLRSLSQQVVETSDWLEPDPWLVDHRYAPADFDVSSAVVYRDVVSAEECKVLTDAMDVKLLRRRYERGHWDAVIIDYKEMEILDEQTFPGLDVLHRLRNHLHQRHLSKNGTEDGTSNTIQWLPCHAIDLKKDGQLQAHVDSVRFSGDLVAGLSLLSASIMRLRPEGSSENTASSGWVDLYLPPRSLYALTGPSRYHYTHELLPCGASFCSSAGASRDECSPIQVHRDRRLSFIFRDAKKE